MKKLIFILATLFFSLFVFSFQKSLDYVPNKETAIKIAEAVWLPIYGESIYNNLPFKAILLGDTIWHVYGSLPPCKYEVNEKGDTISITMVHGGVPHILINKSDGKIWNIYHNR